MDYSWPDELVHYGVSAKDGAPGRGSGRYPLGSGDNPYQHEDYGAQIIDTIKTMRSELGPGHDKEIAEALGMTINEMRARERYINEYRREATRSQVRALLAQGKGTSEIARILGMPNESTARSIRDQLDRERNTEVQDTADVIAKAIDTGKIIDIGPGMASLLGVNDNVLKSAVQLLKDNGYSVDEIYIPRIDNPMRNTTIKYIAAPGVTQRDAFLQRDTIGPVFTKVTDADGGTNSVLGIRKPVSIDSDRIFIRYGPDGGTDRDGTIELRPGVPDLSIGSNIWQQVRIGVDDNLYLKGVAIYSDNIPDGYDVVFNTNKDPGTPMSKVFKKMKTIKTGDGKGGVIDTGEIDWDNPFGSSMKTEEGRITGQSEYKDPVTGEVKLSAINVCKEEGDVDTWRKSLPSQFLAKQTPALAKQQLQLAYDAKKDEFEELKALTLPEARQKLLFEFADGCDSDAAHLRGAPLPGQSTKLLLPLTTLKDDECYCPTYKSGTQLALVRFPHAGIFEIPVVTVNNNNKEGKKVVQNAVDAIGVNTITRDQLSGADCDGDTVLAIPMTGTKVRFSKMLDELKGFSTNDYAKTEGQVPTGPRKYGGDGFAKQLQMGLVSNLITDMTVQGADPQKLARAVKHSMVVIDAEKHNLDWRRSYEENRIAELVAEYQPNPDKAKAGGATTILSKANADVHIPHRREVTNVGIMTPEERVRYDRGEKVYRESGETNKKGELKTITVPRMATVDDAFELTSDKKGGVAIERIYAEHANRLKSMALEARRMAREIGTSKVDQAAKATYAAEVEALNTAIDRAYRNKPYERQAAALASAIYSAKKKDHPEWTKEEAKKANRQALEQARRQTGSARRSVQIDPTDAQWNAIMARAISSEKIKAVLNNMNDKRIKELATPRAKTSIGAAKIARIRHLLNAGNSIADVAELCGVSVSTVSQYKKD